MFWLLAILLLLVLPVLFGAAVALALMMAVTYAIVSLLTLIARLLH